MSLTTVGRNAAVAGTLSRVAAPTGRSAGEVAQDANDKLAKARTDLLTALTPWIPGDFVVTYGVLLTAWPNLRNSFPWLLIVSAASAITFVVLGAFATTGFKGGTEKADALAKRLTVRTVAGFLVSVYASAAIPRSGWYGFSWFRNNEQSWVLTASIVVVALVMVLKGLQKRGVLLPDA